MPKVAEPQRSVHTARKTYQCDGRGRACGRQIRPGDPYTQLAYPPHFAPFPDSHGWTIRRFCSTCEALPAGVIAAGIPCPAASGDAQCSLVDGHYPTTPHEFPIGLF